ncbi:MAG: tetratricopeptide repeat protein [Nitrospiraceae bacterium]
MRLVALASLLLMFASGCTSSAKTLPVPLSAPGGTPAAVAQSIEQGNHAFAAQNWTEARSAYLASIERAPALAEAHYNLALTLERLGDKAEARKHYVQAANLAPGNKVIWNAPPLRKFDGDAELDRKSYMDANPK